SIDGRFAGQVDQTRKRVSVGEETVTPFDSHQQLGEEYQKILKPFGSTKIKTWFVQLNQGHERDPLFSLFQLPRRSIVDRCEPIICVAIWRLLLFFAF